MPSEVAELVHTDVRVKLERVHGNLSVSGFALRYPGAAARIGAGFSHQALKVSWAPDSDRNYLWVVEDRDSGKVLSRVKAQKFELQGEDIRLNLKPSVSRLTLVPVSKDKADVIATMDMEDYIRGVLPGEMPSGWPMEALKAQAIAARTFALYRKQARANTGSIYDLESSVMDQVFVNASLFDNPTMRAKIAKAVSETQGLVLLEGGAKPFAAYFHADCGGKTEEAHNVWGGPDEIGTAADEACPLSPAAHWRLRLAVDELGRRLRSYLKLGTAVALSDLEPIGRTDSGRVEKIKLKWANGHESSVSAHQFRSAIGFDQLRSTNFSLAREGSTLHFKGRGHGHGVGMCQWGARYMATGGKGFREILKHYYPKATLSEMNVADADVDAGHAKHRTAGIRR
jgi:stage II sporulation protein D